ncbi:MAG: hypothetical protein B6A08_18370 [Sorangiineae bacterium NIC37A_2]|nr:MAG: hypothetical protein B6A08_18370 [Sorangiineae bacterium NIC37A_2]
MDGRPSLFLAPSGGRLEFEMWVRKSSIRPVPTYAKISAATLRAVRDELVEGEAPGEALDAAFERFEESQPALAESLSELLERPYTEATLALAYFLSLSLWLAFERAYGRDLAPVLEQELQATSDLLELDEELHRSDATDTLESDDVISMEQPEIIRFIHEHVEATLDVHADSVELSELETVYRAVLVEALALSYAVRPPLGVAGTREVLA